MRFDEHGHILDLTPAALVGMIDTEPKRRSVVDDWFLRGTPVVFATYNNYCAFLGELSAKLQVHRNPSTVAYSWGLDGDRV